MQLELKKAQVKALLPKLEGDKAFKAIIEKWTERMDRYGTDTFPLILSEIKTAPLNRLYEIAKALGDRSIMMNISALLNVRKNPAGAKISLITTALEGLAGYLATDSIDGWLYQKRDDGLYLPYVVRSIKYYPPSGTGDNRQAAYVSIYLGANIAKLAEGGKRDRYSSRGESSTRSLTITSEDLPATPQDIFTKRGFYKETTELKAAYEVQLAEFRAVREAPNTVFWLQGAAAETRSESWWGPQQHNFVKPIKVVNDEELVDRPYTEQADPEWWRKLAFTDDEDLEDEDDGEERPKKAAAKGKRTLDITKGFDETPVHPMALVFDLDKHQHLWAHSSYLTRYVYKPELRDQLVLPQDHRDMIDILTTDIDAVVDDVVEGKSGGTLILCTGKPGLGKTLTPEIVSEVSEKPHYRVTAGVLGVKPEEVEKNLKLILRRAQRWGAITTLDEADVYIRQRGDDLDHNAVVAAFLQQLEYFAGLLFMTTNREDDVDDAIVSRCAAVIRYKTPTPEDAAKIWAIQGKLFGIAMTPTLITQLVTHFSNASGRDIRNLCKTTARWLKVKQQEPSFDPFRICGQFRGM